MSYEEEKYANTNNGTNRINIGNNGIGYILIGEAGTGKSSIINLFCKNDKKAYVEHGANAGTNKTQFYYHGNGKDILIDTVGISDPEGKSDKQIMIDTLKFLQKNKVKNVTIIWTVNHTNRNTQEIQKQAKYINSFKEKNIWQSTIIIIKSSSELSLQQDSQGAKEASAKYNILKVDIPIITFTCMDWMKKEDRTRALEIFHNNKEIRKSMSYFYKDEVKQLIEDALEKLGKKSCQVLFDSTQCIKCGVIGDPRCMPEYCHFQLNKKHKKNGKLNKKREHTGAPKTRVKDVKIEYYHDGMMVRYHNGCCISSHEYFGPITWNHQVKYDCCDMWKGSEGCKTRFECCGQSEGSKGCKREKYEIKETIMSCCGLEQEAKCLHAIDFWTCCGGKADSEGCIDVCKKCDQLWNNSSQPGCGRFHHQIKGI